MTGIYVIDGYDITLYPSPEAAASNIEGYDPNDVDYLGIDGTVWAATVSGPKWGLVRLHLTDQRRPDLVDRLKAAGYEVHDGHAT